VGRIGFSQSLFCFLLLIVSARSFSHSVFFALFSTTYFTCRPETAQEEGRTVERCLRMGVEVSPELRQSFRHVFAAVAEANVAWLVVNAARQE